MCGYCCWFIVNREAVKIVFQVRAEIMRVFIVCMDIVVGLL